MIDYVILVFGHTRPASLQLVLEGLGRQGALGATQVWLDGHGGSRDLLPWVETCRFLETRYPQASWYKYRNHRSYEKVFIDAVSANLASARYVIVLEDDCYPDRTAVQTLLDAAGEVERRPDLFSAYGHHFGTDDEGSETTVFQGWGWISPTSKLAPIVAELTELWNMPELNAIAWIEERITPEIRERMDAFPGRADSRILDQQFAHDCVMNFLTNKDRLRHKKTERRVVYNFGIGDGASNFIEAQDFYFEPPFNMISRDQLIREFDLGGLHDEDELIRLAGHRPVVDDAGPAIRG